MSKVIRDGLENQQKTLAASKGIVITDELNPLDVWQVDESESYREWILRHFPTEVLID